VATSWAGTSAARIAGNFHAQEPDCLPARVWHSGNQLPAIMMMVPPPPGTRRQHADGTVRVLNCGPHHAARRGALDQVRYQATVAAIAAASGVPAAPKAVSYLVVSRMNGSLNW
jgi:hypothetical protein